MKSKAIDSISRYIILLFLLSCPCYSQYNQWTWMHGNPALNNYGIFNVRGTPDNVSHPGAKYAPCAWRDNNNNFWIYGGSYYNSSPYTAANVWRYDPSANQWTWMQGDSTSTQFNPVYGTQGIAAATNTPGPRGFGAATWVDLNNNLWLFGSNGNQSRNDLWKYSTVTNQWTFVHLDSTQGSLGVYGTQGVPSVNNRPRSRYETSATWVDNTGNLWLFGGFHWGSSSYFMNDLWKYNPATDEWTWMHGTANANPAATYGVKGIPAATNVPNGRYAYCTWTDFNNDLWLFGGTNFITGSGGLSDLWKYNIATNMWTWMGGPTTYNDSASFGIKCVEDSTSWPATGNEIRSRWVDDCGNFWLFGSSYSVPFVGTKTYNTLWRYNPTTGLWAWIYGNTAPYPNPVYGTRGISSILNTPAATIGTASFSTDTAFWIYGGMEVLPTNARHGVLWKYIPDRPTADFTSDTVCVGETTHFNNISLANCNSIKAYSWDFGDPGSGGNNYSTEENPLHNFSSPGTYSVQLIVQSCTQNFDTALIPVIVNPDAAIVAQGTATIRKGSIAPISVTGGGNYNWLPSQGLSCTTCANPIASPIQTTTYCVTGINSDGCAGSDCIVITVEDTICSIPIISFIPNAFSPNGDNQNDKLCVQENFCVRAFVLHVYDRWGELVFETKNINDCWDGVFRGKKLGPAVFAYYLDIEPFNGEAYTQKGNISLIR